MLSALLRLTIFVLTFVAAGFAIGSEVAELRSAAPENASVYFLAPEDGATVSETFTVRFGLKGMGVAPAGVDVDGTGHHHLLVDRPQGLDFDSPLPVTEQIIHFGGGQTETELTLTPGRHCLQLLLGNYLHIPHLPPVKSKVICVNVTSVKPGND